MESPRVAGRPSGYDGCLVGTGVLNAGLIGQALDALSAGNPTETQTCQQRSNEILYDLFRRDASGWMAGLKYALCKLKIFSSEFSLLAFPITDEDRRRIEAALEREREFI